MKYKNTRYDIIKNSIKTFNKIQEKYNKIKQKTENKKKTLKSAEQLMGLSSYSDYASPVAVCDIFLVFYFGISLHTHTRTYTHPHIHVCLLSLLSIKIRDITARRAHVSHNKMYLTLFIAPPTPPAP